MQDPLPSHPRLLLKRFRAMVRVRDASGSFDSRIHEAARPVGFSTADKVSSIQRVPGKVDKRWSATRHHPRRADRIRQTMSSPTGS